MNNSTPSISEKLVQYLDGNLDGAEKASIEQLLAMDSAVKSEYDSLLRTRAAIRYYGLKKRVKGLHNQMMSELNGNRNSGGTIKRILRYSMAAAAGVVLLVAVWFGYSFFTLSPAKVFSSNYRTYELSNFRDGDDGEPGAAEKAFTEKNYKEVLRIHDAGEEPSIQTEFLCGLAALETGDDSKAIKCFGEVIDANSKSGKTVLNDESEFYLSLSYIRNKDYDFALPLLKKIKNDPEHKYYKAVSAGLIRKVKLLKWR